MYGIIVFDETRLILGISFVKLPPSAEMKGWVIPRDVWWRDGGVTN